MAWLALWRALLGLPLTNGQPDRFHRDFGHQVFAGGAKAKPSTTDFCEHMMDRLRLSVHNLRAGSVETDTGLATTSFAQNQHRALRTRDLITTFLRREMEVGEFLTAVGRPRSETDDLGF